MMYMKSVALAALVAYAEARFGQEQCQPALGDIQGVTSGGQPGQADTIAGGAIRYVPSSRIIQRVAMEVLT